QTLIPDSTGAASASMPRYAIVINALRPLRAGGGAILLVPSSLKHLKCLQTYCSFSGFSSAGTVTVENREECKHSVNSVAKTTKIRVLLPLSKT
ncbi:hypothetical protein N4S66_15280, partial [Shewanella algae]|uniref:hypothetical protein n=1 Tax=Shewanella algae TaxID=38313 RepID=UPI0021BE8BFC